MGTGGGIRRNHHQAMTITEAREILAQAGIDVYNNRASYSSSCRGIHGAPTYRVYKPGADKPEILKLNQVRDMASAIYTA
jgi:hypothetical protein